MKLGTLAASALIGAASFVGVAFAQGDGRATIEMSRTQQSGSMGTSSRMSTPTTAPVLEGNRPAAGMFPQPTGEVRGVSGIASNAPAEGTDIRNALRRQ
jgi:hypothetical protein